MNGTLTIEDNVAVSGSKIAMYECVSGYRLFGNGTRYCYTEAFGGLMVDLGVWSGIKPFCRGICDHMKIVY